MAGFRGFDVDAVLLISKGVGQRIRETEPAHPVGVVEGLGELESRLRCYLDVGGP